MGVLTADWLWAQPAAAQMHLLSSTPCVSPSPQPRTTVVYGPAVDSSPGGQGASPVCLNPHNHGEWALLNLPNPFLYRKIQNLISLKGS